MPPMTRTLIRFLTRFPFHRDPRPSAALLLFETSPRDVVQALNRVRLGGDGGGRGVRGPLGHLMNDGTVLVVELLRELPRRCVGHASLAAFDEPADTVMDVVTDVAFPQPDWDLMLDGQPVDEDLRPLLTAR